MQLVLLSGGSGKRLWPLSNNARSKQFLKLLDDGTGTLESMVQRVVRQIRESRLTDDITLATNAGQLDIITSQLGADVCTVTEPERRDTFPAIALACSYLSLEKHCDDDETVVVMPCDPYTESGYFEVIRQMAAAVSDGAAPLLLMAIRPTYPSPKFGYIIPGAPITPTTLKVTRFTEKPTVDKARDLLAQGALWNGGVFAFKLGYLMSIVRQYIDAPTFAETRSRYGEFPKISFDYEVVEKAPSVAVVKYDGAWKDLGTWNTLAEEMPLSTLGSVTTGPDNSGTHIINELQTPIFADGLTDLIVAACPDGILVCSKDKSENIKSYVENLTPRPMYEERRWGTYRVLDDTVYPDGRHSLVKTITLFAGRNISYQIHHRRSEVWTFVEGEGLFVLDGKVTTVKAGDTVTIPVEHLHSVKALTDLTFIEVQQGHPLIEEDIERFPYDWNN